MHNVLQLIDGGFIGGGQTHIISICKNIDKTLYNPIIAASPDGEFKALAINEGLKFEDIILPKFYRHKYLNKLEEIVKENNIDIIHSHGGVAGVYARMYKRHHMGMKIIHTIHGIHYTNKNFFTRFLSLSMEQYLVNYTDKFICVSDNDFKQAKSLKIVNADKTAVIKNGIDLQRFKKRHKNSALLVKLGLTKENFVIGNISRFDYQKNQRLILTELAPFLKLNDNVRVILAGDGEYLQECRPLAETLNIKDKVIFTGEINDPEDYFPLFDIFVFPSLWEGLSITLIEAMAAGSCILASSIPGNLELIQNEINGLTFDPDIKGQLKEKVIALYGNHKLCAHISAGAEKDSAAFNEADMTKKIQAEYKNILTS